jgi:RNA polymerase sigma factor (sigma-70 family)
VVTTSPRADRRTSAHASGDSDAVLLGAVARGDDDACRSFVARHGPAVFGLALGMCRDRGVAEDVTQRAFERAWRHAGAYEPDRASARTWLLTIARRLAIDERRRRRADPLAPADLDAILAPAAADTERDALRDAEREAVSRALAALPEPQRRAVVLAALGGRSATEVAAIEAIPLGTAKTRIRLGLRRLRAELDGEVDHG